MTSYPSFNELADQLTDKKHFSAIISRQQKFFQTNPYKIEKLYSDTAKKIYSQILNKYQVTQEFKIMENAWQQNQRRVFVWYMIILVDLHYINLEKINQINWSSLTSVFFDKNQCFLEFQFANILKSKSKITWNQEEDKILLEAMSKEKQGKWNQVSKRIFYESDGQLFKSPKHCRERWFNHLDQTKHKGSWTLQEDYTIFKFIMENGKRWACIVKLLENSRTQHMIKNRYNSLISKLKKNKKRRQQEITELVFKSLETQVKNQRRERKLKNLEKNNLEKKAQILQTQNALQNSVSKPEILEEKISENSTDKVSSIKIEEEAQDEETPKIQVQNNQQGVRIEQEQERPLLNFYHHYAEEYMPFHPYQFYYFCQQSAFMPINPMMFG